MNVTTGSSTSAQSDNDHDDRRQLARQLTYIRHLETTHNVQRDYLLALSTAREILETTTTTTTTTATTTSPRADATVADLMNTHIQTENLARLACRNAASALEFAVSELQLLLLRARRRRDPSSSASSVLLLTETEQQEQRAYVALLRQFREGDGRIAAGR